MHLDLTATGIPLEKLAGYKAPEGIAGTGIQYSINGGAFPNIAFRLAYPELAGLPRSILYTQKLTVEDKDDSYTLYLTPEGDNFIALCHISSNETRLIMSKEYVFDGEKFPFEMERDPELSGRDLNQLHMLYFAELGDGLRRHYPGCQLPVPEFLPAVALQFPELFIHRGDREKMRYVMNQMVGQGYFGVVITPIPEERSLMQRFFRGSFHDDLLGSDVRRMNLDEVITLIEEGSKKCEEVYRGLQLAGVAGTFSTAVIEEGL